VVTSKPAATLVRRLARVAFAAAIGGLLVGAVAPMSDAAVSPHQRFTALTADGNRGSWLLEDGRLEFTGWDVGIDISPWEHIGVVGTSRDSSHRWRVDITAATGTRLRPGTFTTRARTDATTWAMTVEGEGRACPGDARGSVTVHEVGRSATGELTAFAASYSLQCDGYEAPVMGEVRWASSIDYAELGDVTLGYSSEPRPFTITANRATTFGTTKVAGAAPEIGTVLSDTCGGRAVSAGGTCTVTFAGTPYSVGTHQARLEVPDSVNGDHLLPLSVAGVDTTEGGYTSLTAQRVLDTRTGRGVPGGVKGALGEGRTLDLHVAGVGGVDPVDVSAVVLNLTVTGPTRAGYLTAWPTGLARPGTSSINFPAGWTGANLVTVPVGTDGRISIYNRFGSTQVVADLLGYYRDGLSEPGRSAYGSYQPVEPTRLLDTRDTRLGGPTPLESRHSAFVPADFGAELSPHVTAMAVNLTVTRPTRAGWVNVYREGTVPDRSSTVNFDQGQTVSNMSIVPVVSCGVCGRPYQVPELAVYNGSSGDVHVVVDVVGVYDDNGLAEGLRFHPVTPTRIVDTRRGQGTTRLTTDTTRRILVPESLSHPGSYAIATNTTAIAPTVDTYLTLWERGAARPTVSNLNPAGGQVVSNMTMTGLGQDFDFNVYNLRGQVDLAVDVTGVLDLYPPAPPGAPAASLRGAPAPLPLPRR
jgi:hypothetical protein